MPSIVANNRLARGLHDGSIHTLIVPVTAKSVNIDGHGRRVPYGAKWRDFDFPHARVDPGPSPAGNGGPYLKVPLHHEQGPTTHRLYPSWQIGDIVSVKEKFAPGRNGEPVLYAADFEQPLRRNGKASILRTNRLWFPAAAMRVKGPDCRTRRSIRAIGAARAGDMTLEAIEAAGMTWERLGAFCHDEDPLARWVWLYELEAL